MSVNKTCHKIKSTQFLICPLSLWQFSIVYCSDPLEKSLLNLSSISCRQKCPCQSNLPARALHSPILQQSVASCCSQHCAAVHNTVLLSTTLCYCPQHCSAVHNTVLLPVTFTTSNAALSVWHLSIICSAVHKFRVCNVWTVCTRSLFYLTTVVSPFLLPLHHVCRLFDWVGYDRRPTGRESRQLSDIIRTVHVHCKALRSVSGNWSWYCCLWVVGLFVLN